MSGVRILGLVAGAAGLLVVAAWLLQDRLIYLPFGMAGSPKAAGLPQAETVTLTTEDGLQLEAWFVPADGDAAGAVVVLPGNAGNRSLRAPLAAALRAKQWSVLLLDYRGFGGNPGRPSADGVRADARAAAAYVSRRVSDAPVVYYGESLGGAVAADLAGEQPPAAMILRSPFTSLAAVGAVHYPFLPVRLLLRDHFDVTAAVVDYSGPVLVIAGERDTIVPLEQSEAVAKAADARLLVIAGADHNDEALLDGQEVVDAIGQFLDAVASGD